jgi:hypothetical protein
MDEKEFKAIYTGYNDRPCVFAKALLSRCAGCSRSQRLNIAEREAMACTSAAAHQSCEELLPLLRAKALFALKLTHIEGPLPHGKEIKVQCGGLRGLRAAQEPQADGPVTDVYSLVAAARADFGGLDALPYGEIVKAVVAYEPRRRGHSSGTK